MRRFLEEIDQGLKASYSKAMSAAQRIDQRVTCRITVISYSLSAFSKAVYSKWHIASRVIPFSDTFFPNRYTGTMAQLHSEP
jgi:hypothetical protein